MENIPLCLIIQLSLLLLTCSKYSINTEKNRTRNSVLITGGCGFVGRHFTRRFCELGWEVIIVDNLISESALPISNWPRHLIPSSSCDVSYYPMDCRDYFASSDSRRHFTLFMHLAAVAGGREEIGIFLLVTFEIVKIYFLSY